MLLREKLLACNGKIALAARRGNEAAGAICDALQEMYAYNTAHRVDQNKDYLILHQFMKKNFLVTGT